MTLRTDARRQQNEKSQSEEFMRAGEGVLVTGGVATASTDGVVRKAADSVRQRVLLRPKDRAAIEAEATFCRQLLAGVKGSGDSAPAQFDRGYYLGRAHALELLLDRGEAHE